MTRCRNISEFALDDTRRQLDEHRRFVDLVRHFTEVNEMLCEQRLKLRRSEKNAAAPPAAMRFAVGILESYLNKDRSDCQGSQLRCECGAFALLRCARKYFRHRGGRLRLRRAYYHCRVCGSGWFPKDKALGMTQHSVSAGMVRLSIPRRRWGLALPLMSVNESS